LFPGGTLAPKFAYLQALSIGYTQPRPQFEASLKKIVAAYPRDSVSILAKAILDKMNNVAPIDTTISESATSQTAEGNKMLNSIYEFMPDKPHNVLIIFVLIIFSAELPYGTTLKEKINKFNQRNYKEKSLNVTELRVDDKNYVMADGAFIPRPHAKQRIYTRVRL